MTPDLYGAWLNAGNSLQPFGAWLAGAWPNLAAAASLGVVLWRVLRWAYRQDDYRSRNDKQAAWLAATLGERPEPGRPGTDTGLLLDCIAAYGDCDELQRLRNAIETARKEDPHG